MTELRIPESVLVWLTERPTEPVEMRLMRLCCVDTRWIVELTERGGGSAPERSAVAINTLFDGACEGALKRMEYA